MKNKILLTILSSCLLTAVMAQPKKVLADKIVAVVGNKIILKSDIDNSLLDMQRQGMELPADARCLTLEQNLGIKALVLQAEKDSLPVTDEEVETDIDNQIRYFISQYGSKDELEKVAGKSVYQIKEDFKEGFRDRKLAAAMRNKIVEDVKITPNEVKHYFEKIPTDSLVLYESEVEVGQVVVFPKASRDAEQYCIEQLAEYKIKGKTGVYVCQQPVYKGYKRYKAYKHGYYIHGYFKAVGSTMGYGIYKVGIVAFHLQLHLTHSGRYLSFRKYDL